MFTHCSQHITHHTSHALTHPSPLSPRYNATTFNATCIGAPQVPGTTSIVDSGWTGLALANEVLAAVILQLLSLGIPAITPAVLGLGPAVVQPYNYSSIIACLNAQNCSLAAAQNINGSVLAMLPSISYLLPLASDMTKVLNVAAASSLIAITCRRSYAAFVHIHNDHAHPRHSPSPCPHRDISFNKRHQRVNAAARSLPLSATLWHVLLLTNGASASRRRAQS